MTRAGDWVVVAANNGWHLEPYAWYVDAPMTPLGWLLTALAAWWGLRQVRRWWRDMIERTRLEEERRRYETERFVDRAVRTQAAKQRSKRDDGPPDPDVGPG